MAKRGTRPDEPGGEVVAVTITVNSKIDYVRYATRNTRVGQSDSYRFELDDGKQIIYNPSTGYKGLAKKMIDL